MKRALAILILLTAALKAHADERSDRLKLVRSARSFVAELMMASQKHREHTLPETYFENLQRQIADDLEELQKSAAKDDKPLSEIIGASLRYKDNARILDRYQNQIESMEAELGSAP